MSDETQGNAPPQGAQGTDPPEGSNENIPKTEKDLNAYVNRAIGHRLGDFQKKLDGRFTEFGEQLVGKFGTTLDEKLSALKPKEPEPKPGTKKDGDAPSAFKLEDSPEWKASQAEIAALKKRAEDGERRVAEERARNRTTNLRSTLADALGKAGIPADRHRAAHAFLVAEEGRIAYSNGGNGDDLVWRDGEGNETPLAEGLKSWLKTPDAKIFLPPQNPKGSGGGPGNGRGSGPNQSVDDILTEALMGSVKG